MRRLLTILLALGLGLGPVLAAIPAGALNWGWSANAAEAESRLPACCRRNGAHHCAMQASAQALPTGTDTKTAEPLAVSAQNSCPFLPHTFASAITPIIAIAGGTTNQTLLSIEHHAAQPSTAAMQTNESRSHPKRGPPAPQIL